MYLEINIFVSCFGILVHNNKTSTKYMNEKLLLRNVAHQQCLSVLCSRLGRLCIKPA